MELWLSRDEQSAVREVIEYVHGCGDDKREEGRTPQVWFQAYRLVY